MSLKGKYALVTGAGSGLGKAAALRLAREGASVAILSRTAEEVDTVARKITALGRNALPLYADISDTADMQSAFDQITETMGRLDVVFANAGVNGVWAPIDEMAPEEWDTTHAINLRGTFLTVHHAIPLMRENGGSIVITSSINGTRTFTSAGASAYATTKAGQLAFTQMAALELAKYRIRVNAICPGAIESGIEDNTTRINTDKAAAIQQPDDKIPLTQGQPGTAEDVADLVAFLSSDAARHITGTPVWIDSGQSLMV